jgi:transglutaminase-like putative cysteine protease
MLYVEFPASEAQPFAALTSRVQTQSRAVDWSARQHAREDADTLKHWLQPTALVPLDGIVHKTALQATQGARTEVEKVHAIYNWIVVNTYREPKVRGCGTGDIKTMLETGDLGGKCADLNAVFVGLCRTLGIPARDLYGVRLAPSAFGYRTLGANPASLTGAQHCRSEVFLKDHGWVAMDPADVTKVMREETPQWIKSTRGGVVGPVDRALFGGWEGNWMAYNSAVDVVLPHSSGDPLGFLMYPQAEDAGGRIDPYSPENFRYRISAKQIQA